MLSCDWLVFTSCDWCISFSRLLHFFIVGIQASGISIPLPLLMLLGLSLMRIASLTLQVYQCESSSINFTHSSARCCGMLWNGRGLAAGEFNVSVVFFYSVLKDRWNSWSLDAHNQKKTTAGELYNSENADRTPNWISEDQNAPMTGVENQQITADHHAL